MRKAMLTRETKARPRGPATSTASLRPCTAVPHPRNIIYAARRRCVPTAVHETPRCAPPSVSSLSQHTHTHARTHHTHYMTHTGTLYNSLGDYELTKTRSPGEGFADRTSATPAHSWLTRPPSSNIELTNGNTAGSLVRSFRAGVQPPPTFVPTERLHLTRESTRALLFSFLSVPRFYLSPRARPPTNEPVSPPRRQPPTTKNRSVIVRKPRSPFFFPLFTLPEFLARSSALP